MYKTETICRLCLQISESNFEIIDEITKSILDALCLKVDLSLSKEPGICKNCATVLQKSFDLMSTCQNTKDSKSFSVNENTNEKCNKLNGSIINNTDYRACQFCTQFVRKGFYASLNQLEGDLVAMKDVLPNCVLDLYISATEEPVLCAFCHDSIQNHITFSKNWLEVEYKIKHYYEIGETGSKDQIDLGDVLQYFLLQPEAGGKNLSLVNHDKSIYQTESGITTMLQTKNEEFILTAHQLKTETEEIDITSANSDATKYQDAEQLFDKKIQCNDIDTEITKGISEITPYGYEDDAFQNCMLHEKNNSEVPLCNSETCQHLAPWKGRVSFHMLHHKSISKVTHQNGPQDYTQTHKSSLKVPLHKCDTCAYQTKVKSNLRKHMLTHKDISEVSLFKCEICSFRTIYKSSLPQHMLIHKSASEVSLYKCEICAFQTKFRYSLQNHKLTHKDDSEVPLYKCKMCARKTKHKSSLRTHMLIHRNVSEVHLYKCEMCTFQTKYKHSISKHMRRHKSASEIPLYKCEICMYQTKHKDSLRRHKLTHKADSEVPFYECITCAFKTKRKGDLKNHMLMHKNA